VTFPFGPAPAMTLSPLRILFAMSHAAYPAEQQYSCFMNNWLGVFAGISWKRHSAQKGQLVVIIGSSSVAILIKEDSTRFEKTKKYVHYLQSFLAETGKSARAFSIDPVSGTLHGI
jgi:hypothetical protein